MRSLRQFKKKKNLQFNLVAAYSLFSGLVVTSAYKHTHTHTHTHFPPPNFQRSLRFRAV